MVILIFSDGLIIFIYVITHTYRKPVMEEVCLWPPQ